VCLCSKESEVVNYLVQLRRFGGVFIGYVIDYMNDKNSSKRWDSLRLILVLEWTVVLIRFMYPNI
jgi:hypothetical protein